MKEEAKKELIELGLAKLDLFTKEGIDGVFKALEIIVKDTDNKFDDMVLPALPILKEKLLELVEKLKK